MDLKTFVKKSLIQIDSALEEASKISEDYNYKYGNNSSSNKSIDFEIQVYAGEGTETGGGLGIKVASLINIGAKGESSASTHNLSTLSFSVVRERTNKKKQDDLGESSIETSGTDLKDNPFN